jgi:cell wall assembly regulator SMI1
MKIEEVLREKKNLLTGSGATEESINEAEKELALTFSEEYRTYLSIFGIAAYGGHELTGLTNSARVNVVAVTKEQRENKSDIPGDFYVVEETNVDEIVVWQSSGGEIYAMSSNGTLEKIGDSLSEYVERY